MQFFQACQPCKIGRKGTLSQAEKSKIVQRLYEKIFTLEIAKELHRDHRTIKEYCIDLELYNGRSDKGKIHKKANLSRRTLSMIKREVCRNPLGSSKQVFENAGVPDVPKTTRCRILRTIAKFGKPEVRPQLKDIHKTKRMEWARDHLEIHFQTVV